MKLKLLALYGSYLIFCGQALAVNEKLCGYYRDSALEDNSRNKALACGFGGPRWSDDFVSHAGWCSGAKLESVRNESVSRLNELKGCNHSEGMCEQYARNAILADRYAQSFGCHFNDPRWKSTHEGHKGWCLTAGQESIDNEVSARYEDLNRCSRCSMYAEQALGFVEQRENRCGEGSLNGPRWSKDKEGHFEWCLASRQSSAINEQNIRARGALNCQEG